MGKRLSLVIPCRDPNDPKLKELLASIDNQDFPKDELEVLVITEGTSESAKAIGIRRAKGEVIGILASDNELVSKDNLSEAYRYASKGYKFSFRYYHYSKTDDCLNRYFALMGCNDLLPYYMHKNDKDDYFHDTMVKASKHHTSHNNGTLGDNGFFILKSSIEKTDLDNYYHIDNSLEAEGMLVQMDAIWHKTGGNLLKFLAKRYRYGLQHAFNCNRRWHLVDFRKRGDVLRLLWFILASVTFIHPFLTAMRGFLKIRDIAWFIHPIMCFLTVVTYGILVAHLCLRRMYQSLSAHSVGTLA